MSQTPAYIQLDAGEDVPSVRDRLSFIRGRQVLLIWPEDGTALARKLDLVLIQREARRRVIALALVTHDEDVITHAHELGISTFETVAHAERSKWKRGRTRVFIQRHHQPEHHPAPEELMPVASRVRNKRKFSQWRHLLLRVIVLGVLLATIGGALYVALPTAQVTLTIASETLTIETDIIADATVNDVDVDTGIIPATVLRANVQTVGTVETTGTREEDDTRATGMVTFTNETDDALEIPVDTQVRTSAGEPIIFRTTRSATLSGGVGQSVDVPIEATTAYAGDVGNVAAGRINTIIGTLAGVAEVSNFNGTIGGASRVSSVVTFDDQERLMGIVRGQLQASAYQEMQTNLSETQRIIDQTLRIAEERTDWTAFSHNVGNVSETISLDMRAVIESLAVDDRFARQIVFGRLSAQKPPNLVLQTDSFTYQRGGAATVNADGTITVRAAGEGVAQARIDMERLRQNLTNKTPAEAIAYLQQNANLAADSTPQITVSPAWLPRLPLLPTRIEIITEIQ